MRVATALGGAESTWDDINSRKLRCGAERKARPDLVELLDTMQYNQTRDHLYTQQVVCDSATALHEVTSPLRTIE